MWKILVAFSYIARNVRQFCIHFNVIWSNWCVEGILNTLQLQYFIHNDICTQERRIEGKSLNLRSERSKHSSHCSFRQIWYLGRALVAQEFFADGCFWSRTARLFRITKFRNKFWIEIWSVNKKWSNINNELQLLCWNLFL